MSNLLKSKFLLGVMTVAIMFAGVVAVNAQTAEAASCSTFTMTLRQGMRNSQVLCLQQMLNEKGYPVDGIGAGSAGKETTYFGSATKAAVVGFQISKGLTADGIFGPISRANLVAQGNVSGNFPAGCTSASGFSSTTGLACYAVPSAPSGLPAGCSSTAGYSPTTGAKCDGAVVAPPATTGPVTVALATNNPASGSFIAPASGVEFAKYTFSGTGTVTSVKLMRTGVSASTTVSNVYLYDGATRLTDGASIGSDNTVTFNSPSGLFSVAGSKTITVVADTLVADYSLGFTLTGYTANGTASVVSVAGNQMFGASATLATVAMSSATGSGNTDAGLDITVWQGTATVSTRDVLLKRLALRQIGSIDSADVKNFKLYADGVLVATVPSLDANKYVTFDTSFALKTGARTLKVTADVIGGSGRTVQFSLRGTYDISATDTQYNANGTATGTFPFGPSSFTVNAGTLTVVKKTDSQSSNVTLGASDQSLATYTFTAYGEPVKVETLRVGMITTGGTVTDHSLRNVRIMVNGAQVGSNTTVPAAASFATNTGTSFTTNFIVYPGSPATVEIRSDIFDNEGTDDIAAGTVTAVQALLVGGADANNGVPQVSITAIDVPTANNVTGNTLTISSGSMSLAKTTSYADQTVAVPVSAYKIGSFQLSGNSTEAVNLNTIYVDFTAGSTVTEGTDLSDLYVVYGGTMTSVKGTVLNTADGTANENSWSINRVLAKNETIQFDVYATLAASVSTNAIITTLAVAGTTASSGIATYADASGITTLTAGVTGQTITGGTGTVTASLHADTSVSQLVDDSGTFKSLTFKIAAVTDSYTVTDMTVTVANVSAVSTVTLKDRDTGAVIGASKPAAASMTWSGLTLAVNAGQTKNVDVELALTSVGVGAGTSGSSLATVLTAFTARNSAGTSATGTGTATGNTSYIYKAVPLVSQVALPTSALAGGEMVIAKFTVSSNGTGTIAWKQAMFEITKSAAPTLSAATLWNSDTGIQVNAFMEYQNGTGGVASTCVADNTFCELRVTIDAASDSVTDDDYVEQISGARTYEIRSTVGGTLASGNSVAVKLDRNTTTYAAPAAYVTNDNAGTAGSVSFTWSDESASATSDTGVSTWNKDFLVKNLPLNWSLNRN